jgi:hypothetical protein
VGRSGIVASRSGWGLVVGSCKHCNEPSGSINGMGVLLTS